MFKVNDPIIWQLYKSGIAAFWTPEEVDISNDQYQIRQNMLTGGQRKILLNVLSFFAEADLLVMKNTMTNIMTFFEDSTELSSFFAWQTFNESQHAEMYNILLEGLLFNPFEKEIAVNAINCLPSLVQKNCWLQESILDSVDHQLLRWFICEAIWFQSAFCVVFYFKTKNLLPGLTQSNELIARDEGIHSKLAAYLIKKRNRLSKETIQQFLIKGYELECQYIHELYYNTYVPGLTPNQIRMYVQYITNFWCYQLTNEYIFPYMENPLPFMETISLQGKTNFFERRTTEYQRANTEIHNSDFMDVELNF